MGYYYHKWSIIENTYAKYCVDTETPLWIGQEEEDMFHTNIHPILTIETTLALKETNEYTIISNYMKNMYYRNSRI